MRIKFVNCIFCFVLLLSGVIASACNMNGCDMNAAPCAGSPGEWVNLCINGILSEEQVRCPDEKGCFDDEKTGISMLNNGEDTLPCKVGDIFVSCDANKTACGECKNGERASVDQGVKTCVNGKWIKDINIHYQVCDSLKLNETELDEEHLFIDIVEDAIVTEDMRKAANYLNKKGIMDACEKNQFCARCSMTRMDAAVAIGRALELSVDEGCDNYFEDATDSIIGLKGCNILSQLTKKGIISDDTNRFRPNDLVKRSEAAKMLAYAFNDNKTLSRVWDLEEAAWENVPATYEDVPNQFWAFSVIEILTRECISNGCGKGKFCPNSEIRRGDFAVLLARAMSDSKSGVNRSACDAPNYVCLGDLHCKGGMHCDVEEQKCVQGNK